ncbi:hypothetical protein A2837_00505 [Candidatus Kaiserbacteria bacterium RIFCSPHIGHO2_01_FULL_46_22]|uniref:RNA polymerase sigma-70 region 2 domain-containing protein n=1 Tax=Candidatus Kaiserbacteria bacterium RIFCSPHIGHO2_01_FULL_46_22 TaxID=1798475 RepID=A0A1F6BXR4_9BACT|nr:MAG: hypothetical protein A2837_00505 [Candidatus Kaiserbacteria bacterium RIFCSPHIGHO2_01_FULL_46_22]
MLDKTEVAYPTVQDSEFKNLVLEQMDSLKIYALILTKSKAQAEDLSQDVYVTAITHQDQFRMGTYLGPWLRTIMKNQWYGFHRKHRREELVGGDFVELLTAEDANLHDLLIAPQEDLQFEERQQAMHDLPLLACLHQEHADSLIAVHYLEFTYEDAAFLLRVNLGTLKSRVGRAANRIKQLRSDQVIRPYDLSAWGRATREVAVDDPYFPIAQAYESMYAFIVSNIGLTSVDRGLIRANAR